MADIKIDYAPRQQFQPFHQRGQRWSCIVAHRRAGKTVACVNELVIRALYTPKKNARYAYIAPFYAQAKNIAWGYLKEATQDFAVEVRESDLRVILPNGAWISLYGADNPDSLRGIYLDGCILDEYGDCRPSLWAEVILPTLADRRGWACFIGTPKGLNHFYDIAERAKVDPTWFHMELKASDSGLVNAEDLAELRTMMDTSQYAQEFECSFTAAVRGTYYADLIETMELDGKMHRQGVYTPNKPVYVAADLGFSDSTAFWFFQDHGDTIDIIDYEEHQGEVLEFYIRLLESKEFPIETLFLPHDAKQKTLQTGRGTVEQLQMAGFRCDIVPRLAVQQGIDAARLILPTCVFDVKADAGVSALRAYKRSYNELTKSFQDKPNHDWASDGADAFRYLSLVAAQKDGKLDAKPKEPLDFAMKYSLESLYEEKEADAPTLSVISRRF